MTRPAGSPEGPKARSISNSCLRVFVASWLALGTLTFAAGGSFESANDAWQRGDYTAALNGFIQILNGPKGDTYVDRIAEITGELYRSTELTPDGRAARFSPDGRYIVY